MRFSHPSVARLSNRQLWGFPSISTIDEVSRQRQGFPIRFYDIVFSSHLQEWCQVFPEASGSYFEVVLETSGKIFRGFFRKLLRDISRFFSGSFCEIFRGFLARFYEWWRWSGCLFKRWISCHHASGWGFGFSKSLQCSNSLSVEAGLRVTRPITCKITTKVKRSRRNLHSRVTVLSLCQFVWLGDFQLGASARAPASSLFGWLVARPENVPPHLPPQ